MRPVHRVQRPYPEEAVAEATVSALRRRFVLGLLLVGLAALVATAAAECRSPSGLSF